MRNSKTWFGSSRSGAQLPHSVNHLTFFWWWLWAFIELMKNWQSENDQIDCKIWSQHRPEKVRDNRRRMASCLKNIAHSMAIVVSASSMLRPKSIISSSILILLILSPHFTTAFDAYREVFTDQWAVKINGGPAAANRLAEKHGFKNLGEVYFLFSTSLKCYFIFKFEWVYSL